MNGSEVYRRIIESGIMPTTFVYDVAETVSLSRTLHENGIRVIELLQRTPDALRAVGAVKEAIPGMVVGAGTVRTLEAAKEAAAAGADFMVWRLSPAARRSRRSAAAIKADCGISSTFR